MWKYLLKRIVAALITIWVTTIAVVLLIHIVPGDPVRIMYAQSQGTTEEHAIVIRWARYPNTVMKLSSLPPKDQYPHRDIGPVIRILTNGFGPERLIYGGGFGVDALMLTGHGGQDSSAADGSHR